MCLGGNYMSSLLVVDQNIALIKKYCIVPPQAFRVAYHYNQIGLHEETLLILGFATVAQLTLEDTLALFAEWYQAVLAEVDGAECKNIRLLQQYGLEAVTFLGTKPRFRTDLQQILTLWDRPRVVNHDVINRVLQRIHSGYFRIAERMGTRWYRITPVEKAWVLHNRLLVDCEKGI